ncbi:MAG: toxin HicA [Chloroflexi bacterium]|nr:toxin HicA [Chloroflexota bacterium]
MTDSIEKIIKQIRKNPKGVSFSDLSKVCKHYFGEPRHESSSHCIYKTPWQGDPRINIQNDKGKAKAYQVRQVIQAIDKLEAQNGNKTNNTK